MRAAIAATIVYFAVVGVCAETSITINGKRILSTEHSAAINGATVIVERREISENVIRGSGKLASETRQLTNFEELVLDISANVTVAIGDAVAFRLTADENILPLISTERFDKVLRITSHESYSSRQGVTVAIEIPLLTRAEINGPGRISIKGLATEKFAARINGSGDIHAAGAVAELRATINGSGSLHAFDLNAERVKIVLSGSGNADVYTREALTASVTGSGYVSYFGEPSMVDASVKGSGNIRKQ